MSIDLGVFMSNPKDRLAELFPVTRKTFTPQADGDLGPINEAQRALERAFLGLDSTTEAYQNATRGMIAGRDGHTTLGIDVKAPGEVDGTADAPKPNKPKP